MTGTLRLCTNRASASCVNQGLWPSSGLSVQARYIDEGFWVHQLHAASGDLLFVATPGDLYAAARAAAQSDFDHIVCGVGIGSSRLQQAERCLILQAIVLDSKRCLHIGPPKVRVLALSRLLDPRRGPTVLRPNLSSDIVENVLADLKRLVGARYASGRYVLGDLLHAQA